jgi:DNA polymerase (family 10)
MPSSESYVRDAAAVSALLRERPARCASRRQPCRAKAYVRAAESEAILRACAAHGVAVEINANPWRLDLDWRWHQRALELGCMMSINPDAHSTRELDLTHWGVEIARKGGVPADRVLNALTLPRITAFLRSARQARAA